jgi:phosphatidate cytidylyltransferase
MFEKKKYIAVILYLISGFVFLTLIPFMDGEFTPKIIVSIFILIWCNDTFAYLIGKNFGKIKLLERISPKKTIEGFLGGLLGAIIASFIIFKYVEIYSLQVWITLACIASVFGTIGDLIQSKFKRQAGVKDSGVLMPGHGGLYDRLDSIIYASPFIFAFLEIVNYVS